MSTSGRDTSGHVTSGHGAVMAQRRPKLSAGETWQDLELFPTPPWATRALCEIVLPALGAALDPSATVNEPAAGLGHMSAVLEDYAMVAAADVYLYSLAGGGTTAELGIARRDFLDAQAAPYVSDWVITNPPFAAAELFLDRALAVARRGVALLLRTAWTETAGRFETIFRPRPPSFVAQFAERVPMCEGGWDPQGSTATTYAWFVWLRGESGGWPAPSPWESWPYAARFAAAHRMALLDYGLIPPVCRQSLTRPADAALAARCVPGWVAPRLAKRQGAQGELVPVEAGGCAPPIWVEDA